MDVPPEKHFADSCSAGPLELLIERAEDGAEIARGGLDQPFALIGRDPYCDIHLNDPIVALRHAFAQVINGNLFIIDLASTTGVYWPNGRQTSGWLSPGEPLHIGPFRLFLTRPVATNRTVLAPDFQPLTSNAEGLPAVVLEFRTGRTEHTAWEVNRALTLVGRASECKLHLAGDDIALFHAYFVKTLAGLWVVDLLARGGTKVNGKKVRLALLKDGDELAFGKFAIGVKYPRPILPANAEDSSVSFNVPGANAVERVSSQSNGMNSSARIGKPPDSTMLATEEIESMLEEALAPLTPAPLVPLALPAMPITEAGVIAMLRQIADLQGAMLGQLQQSLGVMLKLSEIAPELQPEINDMIERNGELQKLQAEILRSPAPEATPVPAISLPAPIATTVITEETANQHQEMWERMEKLNDERQGLWQRLIGKGLHRT